jgi:hypothetical protein
MKAPGTDQQIVGQSSRDLACPRHIFTTWGDYIVTPRKTVYLPNHQRQEEPLCLAPHAHHRSVQVIGNLVPVDIAAALLSGGRTVVVVAVQIVGQLVTVGVTQRGLDGVKIRSSSASR